MLLFNHTAHVSGAERSLLELVDGLPASVEPVLGCPEGALADLGRQRGIPVVVMPGTEGSLKLHPSRTPAALAELARAAVATARMARRVRADVVHANSIRAGLFGVAAKHVGAAPAVVHVRDRLPPGLLTSATLRVIGTADALIANSRYTAEPLARSAPAEVHVVYNPVRIERFAAAQGKREHARAELGLAPTDVGVGVVGQITPWKGQAEAIRAVELLTERHPQLRLLLVGETKFVSSATRYDNRTYLRELELAIERPGLRGRVALLGERSDIPAVMAALDVLLVPSWEEPFGRVVVEAMASGTPVVATSVGGPREIVREGVSGLLVQPQAPEAWSVAIDRLIVDGDLRRRLVHGGLDRARAFDVESHVRLVTALYEQVAGRPAGSRQPRVSGVVSGDEHPRRTTPIR